MEKLEPIEEAIVDEIADAAHAIDVEELYPEDVAHFQHLFTTYPRLEEVLRAIAQICRKTNGRIDLHLYNAMSRAGMPVLTDPVSAKRAK